MMHLYLLQKILIVLLQWPPHNFKDSNWSMKLNWGINNNPFNTEWIMRLDADEVIDEKLSASIKHFINSKKSQEYDGCKFNKAFSL